MENLLQKYQTLDGRTLKIIAVISMLIDHIGVVFFPQWIVMRIFGRIAFPIYCFLLIEGVRYTHDLKKYMMRIGIFAVLSEIPFDLAFYGSALYTGHQNVFLTLLIGLVMIYYFEHPLADANIPDLVMGIITVGAAGIAAELLKADYGFAGIAIIFVFYILRENPLLKYLLTALLLISMGKIEAFSVIALIPIILYNGQRGQQNKVIQYGFYLFYPVHLIIIGLIAWILGNVCQI